MIVLSMDSSSLVTTVALLKDEHLLGEFTLNFKREHSVILMEKIEMLLKDCQVDISEVDGFVVSKGPGSFTGVRIGVTICKTFAWTLNKKVIPISSLELLASTNTNYELNVAMIDARRDCVYAGVYDNELNTVIEDRYISIEQLLLELKDKNYILISDDDFENLKKIDSKIDILKVINKHKNDVGVNPHSLNPTYLKITEAEAKLQTKNND